MSPSADAMALSTSSHNLSSSSRNSSTDSMGMFTGSKNGLVSRFFKRKFGLKKDEPNVPAPIDTKTANADTGNSRNRKGPKTVIPKPGMIRTESERRDRLVEAPLSPSEKRLQRLNPRGTLTSLAPIQSRSVGDLNENNDQGVDERRRSYVDPKLSSTHTPTSYSRNSHSQPSTSATAATTVSTQPQYGRQSENQLERQTTAASTYDTRSFDSRSNYGGPGPESSDANAIDDSLDWRWILNLSMHFRDHSHREKFFVTYAEKPNLRRRVTVSCDYRHPEPGSLEDDLSRLKSQKEKSNRIYESIKEALTDIKFYDTTTNLKLHTQEGRLNVHVTEDMHEIIYYPPVSAISHLDCAKIRESDLAFDSHLSGFVYKVMHGTQVYIKKEIPSPDTVDEFLYEINALYALRDSNHVIRFGGCVLDDKMEKVKGLLISFAPKGALIDVLYNERNKLPWSIRESWARQIVGGLADIHEGGYVQGDFTLSNIVIDEDDTAKIIDINRRGCPVGWEPPEITVMLEGLQRIGIYIGIKSDIFQLGMCLWAIAMQNDEPEYETRPLSLKYAPADVPEWYKEIVALCLAPTPQARPGAKELLSKFPPPTIANAEPLSPIVYEARFDDANLSSPPSPAQLNPEYIQMNGLKYEVTSPDPPPPANVNMIDSDQNYERFEAGIEQNTKLEEEVTQSMDVIVDDVEPVTTHPLSRPRDPALAAASAAWGLNGTINGSGSSSGSGNGNGIASKPVKPALEIPPYSSSSTNGAITNSFSGSEVNGNGKGKLPTVSSQTAERAVKRSSGASGLSGKDSPVRARHTDSGFAEIAGEESPVSPKTIPASSRVGAGGSSSVGIGGGGRR